MKEVTDAERLQAAMVAMEGRALNWYQLWEFCVVDPTWAEFRTALLERFQPTITQNPYELLLGLKQFGSVEEYREQFELYAGPLKGANPEYLKGIFLNEINDLIKAELKLHPMKTLPELMGYAQKIDERNALLNKGVPGSYKGGGGSNRSYTNTKTVMWETGTKNQQSLGAKNLVSGSDSNSLRTTGSFRGRGFEKLSSAEMQEKKNKRAVFSV